MRPPLDVDKEAVRMLVLTMGVREAARQMGLNEDTVLAWSSRGKWLAHLNAPPVIKPISMQKVSAINAISPVKALENSLQVLGKETRYGLAKAAKKGAECAAELSGAEVLNNARSIKEIAGVASIVHSWGETQASVHISCMGGEQPGEALEIDVEVSSVPEIEDSYNDDYAPDIDEELDSY